MLCNIVPGRLPRGREYLEWLERYAPQGGPPNLHPEQPPPGTPQGGKLGGGGHGQRGKSE
jgi:hypothetical protein